MSITPAIRDFLVRLEDLLDAHHYGGHPEVTDVDTAAFVKLGGIDLPANLVLRAQTSHLSWLQFPAQPLISAAVYAA